MLAGKCHPWLFSGKLFRSKAIRFPRPLPVLGAAALVLLSIARHRGGEYDEFYSVFLIAGDPRPHWPALPFAAAAARHFYEGHASFGRIALALRDGDVHPPLYFWLLALWARIAGHALFALRLLSVLETLAGLAVLGRIARRIGVSAPLAILLTTLCYGFTYTGIVARDFALATLCTLGGTLLLIGAEQETRPARALAAGILLGAACFSNYLASFTTLALLLWLTVTAWRRWRLWLAAGLGAALFIPAGIWFFAAQAGSRRGQYPPFNFTTALSELARNQAGALIGALPRYVPPHWSMAVTAGLALILGSLALLVARHGLRNLAPRHRTLLATGFAAPPLGLLLLGLIFDNTPIEMRYLWLGLPFAGLAFAATLRERPLALTLLLAVQGSAIIGLALAPATMQPADRTVRAAARLGLADTLVIVPFGNDGVGIPGPFIAAAPPAMRILVARRAAPSILGAASAFPRVAIARIRVDQASRALVPRLEHLFNADRCWQSVAAKPDLAVFANQCREKK